MKTDFEMLRPIAKSSGRRTAVDVYEALQGSILGGKLKPGTILSQVDVARALNVSRTPVREAMRMLQEGGLLVGEPNYRCQVVGFDAEDVEVLYMRRVALEAMGVAITTMRMTAILLKELTDTVEALESDESHSDFECWRMLHRQLHRLIVAKSGAAMVAELSDLELRSTRYQTASKGAHLPGWWHRGEAEHRGLFDAIRRGDAALAGQLSARHLARTALEQLAALAPEHDASRLRDSLKFAIGGAQSVARHG